MGADRDPVLDGVGDAQDLYDIATWERRTPLAGIAVCLHDWLRAIRRPLLIFAAGLILIGELALTGFAVFESRVLGLLTGLSLVPAVLLAGYLWHGDPTLREPVGPLVVTFLLGLLFAGFAPMIDTQVGALFSVIPVIGLALLFFLVVGAVGQFVKWLAVRMH